MPVFRPRAGLGWVRRPRTWRGSPVPWVPGGPGEDPSVVVVGVRRAPVPSVSCRSPPGLEAGDMTAGGPLLPFPRRPRAGSVGNVCSATRASRSPFPTTSSSSRPGLPLPGRGVPACPLPSPRGSRGGAERLEQGADRAGTRGGPGFTSTSPHAGNRAARHPHRFRGGSFLIAGNPGVGPPFGQARARGGGRIIIIKVSDVKGRPVTTGGGTHVSRLYVLIRNLLLLLFPIPCMS